MARKQPPKKGQERQQPEAEEEDEFANAPLFSSAEGADHIVYIAVSREEPEEGYLGRLKPHATEADIKRKWGGGTFTLSARNQGGKPVKGGHKSVEISGDPIFQSRAHEQKWRKALDPDGAAAGKATSGEARPMSIADVLILADKSAEKARESTQSMFAALTALQTQAHQQQLQMVQQQQTLQRQADEAERQRSREFMSTMIQVVTNKSKESDPVGTLLQGMKLMRDLGGPGDGEADPLAILAGAVPSILREGRKMFQAGGGQLRLANPDDEEPDEDDEPEEEGEGAAEDTGEELAAEGEEEGDEETAIELRGEIAQKMADAKAALEARGIDPETALGKAFDMLAGKLKPPARPTPAPAPPSAAAQPEKARPGKASRRRPAAAPLPNGQAPAEAAHDPAAGPAVPPPG